MDEKIVKKWIVNTKIGHKHRGYNVNITSEYLYELAIKTTNCPYCGIAFDWNSANRRNLAYPSLDNITNDVKLNDTNVEIICRRCNTIKGQRSKKEFIDYCTKVADKYA